MNSSNENFSTPVQRKGSRHLGLKRNNSSIKKTASLEEAATTKQAGPSAKARNGITTTPRMQPQSDAKVNYRNQGDSNKNNDPKCSAHTTPATPNTSCLLQRQSVSTNCRPYRLSLSKRVREKMSKKRLEFHIANEIEKEAEERKLNQQQENEYSETAIEKEAGCRVFEAIETSGISKSSGVEKDPTEMSRDELLAAIDQTRKELKARQTHASKAQELQQAINTWQNGFSMALRDLQKKIVPRVDKERLLEQLRIPQEMIKYVND